MEDGKSIPADFEVLIFEREISGIIKKKAHALTLDLKKKTSVWFSLSFEETGKFGKMEKKMEGKEFPSGSQNIFFALKFLCSVSVFGSLRW